MKNVVLVIIITLIITLPAVAGAEAPNYLIGKFGVYSPDSLDLEGYSS